MCQKCDILEILSKLLAIEYGLNSPLYRGTFRRIFSSFSGFLGPRLFSSSPSTFTFIPAGFTQSHDAVQSHFFYLARFYPGPARGSTPQPF